MRSRSTVVREARAILTGLTFEDAWPGRERGSVDDVEVNFIGREAFIRNKRATGRPKDLGDIDGMD